MNKSRKKRVCRIGQELPEGPEQVLPLYERVEQAGEGLDGEVGHVIP